MFGLLIFTLPAVILASPLTPRTECPKFTPMENFDVAQYLGRWYDIEHSPWEFGMANQLCVSPVYSFINETTVRVENYSRFNSSIGQFPIKADGTASVTDISGSLLVNFPYGDSPSPLSPDGFGNYNVLKTDYVTYTCVYDCQENEDQVYNSVIGWVIGRTPQLDEASIKICEDLFTDLGVDLSIFLQTYQEPDCTYPGE